jgi:hypothetical protein
MLRIFAIIIALFITACDQAPKPALPPLAKPSADNKLINLGRPIMDDADDMYDRYVFFDGNSAADDTPLNLPLLANPEIEDWITTATSDALTMAPNNFAQRTKAAQHYFTPTGYAGYQLSLANTKLEQVLRTQNYNLTTIVASKPIVHEQGEQDNIYKWRVTVPLLMTYTDALKKGQSYKLQIKAEIVRIKPWRINKKDTTQTPQMVAINAWEIIQQ